MWRKLIKKDCRNRPGNQVAIFEGDSRPIDAPLCPKIEICKFEGQIK